MSEIQVDDDDVYYIICVNEERSGLMEIVNAYGKKGYIAEGDPFYAVPDTPDKNEDGTEIPAGVGRFYQKVVHKKRYQSKLTSEEEAALIEAADIEESKMSDEKK